MIRIRRAITREEQEAVYRFRYSVYVEEMGRYQATADHINKRLVDPEDGRSWNFYAHDGDGVVASHRCTWGPHGFSDRQIEQYGLEPFVAELPAPALLVGERTMVAAAARGTTVATDLANGATFPIPDDDICVAFGACEPHLVSYYARLGTYPYAARNINSEESGYLVPLVSFPRGVSALNDLGRGHGLPECIRQVFGSSCAVLSSAVVGATAYRERLADELEVLRRRGTGSFFEGLTDDEVTACISRSSAIDCVAGDRVLKRGGCARNVFVVLGGRLEARDEDGSVVGTLQPGEAFGETAFLLQQPRTLDVYAVDGEARILSLSERVLRCILHDRPDLATKLLMNLSKILCARA
jgi:hypothetical protein